MEKYLGMKLDNRYELLEIIGSGGMAIVYKARDLRLNRLVAVKILKDDLALDAEFRRRFHTESQAVAMLSNPNIVAVYDVSKTDEVEFIVMELIEGITLKQYMNRKGQLSWKESLHFATQIAKALSHAHSRGIIHRDIKPHNIMILKDGSVKVADFGIARLQSSQSTTLTQEALGSVHYISPEQAKGAMVDTRTDIYSLGVVLYEMLTSRLPFEGESPVSVAIQHISSIPLNPRDINPDIPKGLETITMKAMSPDLNERYQTADELLKDMEEFRKNPEKQIAVAPVKKAVTPKEEIKNSDGDKKNKASKESSKKKKKKKSVSTLTGVLCVFGLLIAIFIFLWVFILSDMFSSAGEQITVEDFTGLKYEDVLDNEEYAEKYEFETEEKETDEYDEGIIISQNPAGGRKVTRSKGELIKVTLTYAVAGEEEITMPDLTNVDYRQAQIDLNNLNMKLNIVKTEVASEEVTEGYVVRSSPQAGRVLTEGSTVTLYVSTGPSVTTTSVPDLFGTYETKAKQKLEAADLTYETKYVFSDTAASGIVIGQDIRSGTEVPIRTTVVLTISKGKDPNTVVSPSPSPSESASPSPIETTDVSPSESTEPSEVITEPTTPEEPDE